MNALSPFISIDFGTSTSKMAWYNPKTNQAEIILNSEGESETPSAVYYGEHETLVGNPALEMLDYEQERERVILSVKRELIATPLLALPGKALKPTEVAAEILRKLRRDAQEQHFHQEITRVVITYPASFGHLERDKIREAARIAGFAEVEMLEEPVAAALAYAQMGLRVGKSVLVYDLGGGTFDLAVLTAEEDGVFRLAFEPQGIKRCGGDDFDEVLYNHCNKIAQEKVGRPISQNGKRDLHFLQQCRQRKENLSTAARRMFKSLLEPGAVLFQYEIERATFESLISATVEETVRKTKALLEQANTAGQAVDTMVLIGGSSRVPLVQRLLEKNLPLKPLQWQNRDLAVALGAAYHAQGKWGGLGEALGQERQPAKKTSPIIQASSQIASISLPKGEVASASTPSAALKAEKPVPPLPMEKSTRRKADAASNSANLSYQPHTSWAVDYDPAQLFQGKSLTIFYNGFLSSSSCVYLHWGQNGWQNIVAVDKPMVKRTDGFWQGLCVLKQRQR